MAAFAAPLVTAALAKFLPMAQRAAPFVGVGSRPALKGAVGATGIGVGLDIFSNGFSLPFIGGGEPNFGSPIVKSWETHRGDPRTRMYLLENGKMATVKANGVLKTWRPYKPVVIPKHWDSTSMRRVARAMKRTQKTAIELVRMAGGEASATKRAKTRTTSRDGGGKVSMYSNAN
jgi:hypothetical protein